MNTEQKIRNSWREITLTLIRRQLSITAMESCTSGQIASLITDTEGSSAVLKGAFVTYSNEAKIRQGVPAAVIEACGVYSAETAAAMAEAACRAYPSDIAIGITGSLGTVDPVNRDSIPGEVFFAIRMDHRLHTFHCTLPVGPGRLELKLAAAEAVAAELKRLLKM